jgi:hypothetical protein
MFGDVWRWAGKYRATERNIGIHPWKIAMEMRVLLDDVELWIERDVYPPDEIALRFHHRLTFIHPFPNGNGRRARLMADLQVIGLGGRRFTWDRESLRDPGTSEGVISPRCTPRIGMISRRSWTLRGHENPVALKGRCPVGSFPLRPPNVRPTTPAEPPVANPANLPPAGRGRMRWRRRRGARRLPRRRGRRPCPGRAGPG